MRIIRTLYNVSRNLVRNFLQNYRARLQARDTRELRKKRSTDYKRWERTSELFSEWDERTKILAGYLKPGSRIIEFGAGNMVLKNFLPSNCHYTPSDIFKRSGEVLVCDLNNTIMIDLSKFDTAVFSGVLEYVYDIDKVFEQLEPFVKHLVLSYSCIDLSEADRLERGWLSDYSQDELERVFRKHDYNIIGVGQWRNQALYSLEQKKSF